MSITYNTTSCLRAQDHDHAPIVLPKGINNMNVGNNGDVSAPIDANYYRGTGKRNGVEREVIDTETIVRRLTPKECARLQGFPPDWCDDVPHSDSAEYKLWGNGIALPCILPMMKAMADILREG